MAQLLIQGRQGTQFGTQLQLVVGQSSTTNFDKIQIVANATNHGLTNIAGIKTLDTSILAALVVALIVTWLHNKYFDKKLPDWLGTFQGSTYVYVLSFFLMIPLALITCWGWPKVQLGISSMQHFIVSRIHWCWGLQLLKPYFASTILVEALNRIRS